MNFFKKAKVEVVEDEIVYAGWNRMHRREIDYTASTGETMRIEREVVDHGAAAAVLLYDVSRDIVVLVRQFRTGAHFAGKPAFMLELPAGLTDGDDPQEAAKREALEETGYEVGPLRKLMSIFPSPGALSEEVHLYAGLIDATHKVAAGGGLDYEHEDLEVVELPLHEAVDMIATGEITDAKTIIALQWALLNREALKSL